MMERPSPTLARVFLPLGVAALMAGLIAAAPGSSGHARAADRLLPLDVLGRALRSEPLDDGIAADQVAFFEARLAARPDDVLSMRSVAAARLLRFRAYNDPAELDRAAAMADGLDRWHPGDAGVRATRTSLALAGHDFATAVDHARAYQALRPAGDEGATLTLFDALWAAGKYEAARRLLEGADFHHESAGVLSRQARLVDGLGDVEGAADRMVRVVRKVDAYAEAPLVRAWARVEAGTFLLHAGRPERAVALYAEALELVPGYPAALESLGWMAYGVDHDLAAAEALFLRSAEYGAHLDLHPLLAEIAEARGARARADHYMEVFFERLNDEGTRDRMFWRPLAEVLAEDPQRRADALDLAERDLRQRQDRGAWVTRGWVLHRMGRHDEAVADVERALVWGAPPPPVLYRAGAVLLAAGDRGRGRHLLRQALEGRQELGPAVAAQIEALLRAS